VHPRHDVLLHVFHIILGLAVVTLKGTTGTAFTLAFQSCVGQVGGVVGPQLFQAKFAYNGYKTPFIICAALIGAAFLANIWTWWLTRNVEWDVRRIRTERIAAEKEGRIFAKDDIKVYDERRFYAGVRRKDKNLVRSFV
jgi:nitrate/nitrite transporter NarK